MGGRHDHGHLVVHGASAVHRAPAEVKVSATLLFVLGVVLTPPEAFGGFALHAAIVAAAARAARVPLRTLLPRLGIEVPFVAFAAFLPLVGGGERVDVGPLSLSVSGLWAAWNIVAKATLGVLAAALLSATTEIPDLLVGLRRLRVPAPIVAIAAFMTRYLDVLAGQMARMQIARISRGDDPRFLWQARAVAATSGTMFVRSYERGERIYLAMCARGFDGGSPVLDLSPPARAPHWLAGLLPGLAAVGVAAAVGLW